MKSESTPRSFCCDVRCDYYRKHETLYDDIVLSNSEASKNIYSFRHFISSE